MSKLRIGLLVVLLGLLLFVAIFFWGSLASAFSILSLILIPGLVAYRRLWIDREDHEFDEMDPMNIIYRRHLESVEDDE